MNKDSIMFAIEGIDGYRPRLVARKELITVFAAMAQSDLFHSHVHLLDALEVELPAKRADINHYDAIEVGELLELLEIHTRAVHALQVLLSVRSPEELVEAHMP